MDPLVTVGIVSFNRLHYLRATLESARECIDYPNVQWLVVDGGSTEPGLRDYLDGLEDVEVAYGTSGLLADSMNQMLELTAGEFLLMLPDRVQFIVRGPWLRDLVDVAGSRPKIGNISFDAQRRPTLRRHFLEAYLPLPRRRVRLPFRRPYHRIHTGSGLELLGYGRTIDGINTGGIAFCRTELFRRHGPWRTTMELQLTNDAGLGTETEMLERYRRTGPRVERFLMRVPVAAGIVTDPRGTTAKIRQGNRRYGRYIAPPNGERYYRVHDYDDALERFGDAVPAAAFEDIVEPIGFELPLDESGNMRKTSVIREDEPYELVDQPA